MAGHRGVHLAAMALVCLAVTSVPWSEARSQTLKPPVVSGSLRGDDITVDVAKQRLAEALGLTVEQAEELQRLAAARDSSLDSTTPISNALLSDYPPDSVGNNADRADQAKQDAAHDPEIDVTESGVRRTYRPVSEEDSPNADTSGRARLAFDLSSWPATEDVTGAELRLAPQFVASIMADDPHQHALVKITVHDHRRRAQQAPLGNGGDTVATRVYFLHGEEQCRIDVTSLVSAWTRDPSTATTTHSVELQVSPGPPVFDEDGVLKTLQLNFSAPSGDATLVPLLYVQSKLEPEHLHRLRRNADDEPETGSLTRSEPCHAHPRATSDFSLLARTCNAYCKRFDVATMEWAQLIIAPQQFEMGYCAGGCRFPLGAAVDARRYLDERGVSRLTDRYRRNVTAHARLQAKIAAQNPELPLPRCVPISYSILTVLYLDHLARTVVKIIPDLKMRQCGCA